MSPWWFFIYWISPRLDVCVQSIRVYNIAVHALIFDTPLPTGRVLCSAIYFQENKKRVDGVLFRPMHVNTCAYNFYKGNRTPARACIYVLPSSYLPYCSDGDVASYSQSYGFVVNAPNIYTIRALSIRSRYV